MQSSRGSVVGTEDTEGKKDSKGEKGRNTVSLSHGEAFFCHRSWIMTSPSSFHHLITAINFRLIIIIPFAERETLLDKYCPVKDDAIYYPVVQGSRFLFCYISQKATGRRKWNSWALATQCCNCNKWLLEYSVGLISNTHGCPRWAPLGYEHRQTCSCLLQVCISSPGLSPFLL